MGRIVVLFLVLSLARYNMLHLKLKNDIDFEVDDTSEVSGDDEVDVDDEDSTTSSEEEIIEGTTRSGHPFKNL
jgi:hypothetical protein